jgi:hypothetical protein
MAMQNGFTSKEACSQVAYSLAMMSIFAPVRGACRGLLRRWRC